MSHAIEVIGLTKSYRTKDGEVVDAVRGIDLHVAEGEILAFLGSNGAGKTTTIEFLEGFRERTSGEVRVLGEDPGNATKGWRENIGIVLQESSPDRVPLRPVMRWTIGNLTSDQETTRPGQYAMTGAARRSPAHSSHASKYTKVESGATGVIAPPTAAL